MRLSLFKTKLSFFIVASLLFTGTVLLSGCQIHRIDVQQGNCITADKVEQLHNGMTKQAVVQVMGSTVAAYPFTENRWTYIYYLRPGKRKCPMVKKQVIIHFANNRISQIDVICL